VFRPLTCGLITRRDYRLAKTKALLGETPCSVLEKRGHSADQWSIWVEEKAPFRVRRHLFANNGKVVTNTEFSYDGAERLPKKWGCASYLLNGRLNEHVVAELTEVSLGKALPAEEFELSYPPGTVLKDYRKKQSGPSHSIMLEDGKRKEIKGDPETAYREMFEPPRLSFGRVAMTVGALGFTVGLVAFVWKHKRKESVL